MLEKICTNYWTNNTGDVASSRVFPTKTFENNLNIRCAVCFYLFAIRCCEDFVSWKNCRSKLMWNDRDCRTCVNEKFNSLAINFARNVQQLFRSVDT